MPTRPSKLRTCLAIVAALALPAATAAAKDAKPPRQKMLLEIFSPIMREIGTFNTQRAEIVSGPVAIKTKKFNHGKGMVPTTAKQWDVRLGQSAFKITIDDEAKKWTIQDALGRVEQMPAPYRRCLEVISEKGKTGLTYYVGLGGAHGSQDYINVEPGAGARCMVHEAGHCLEQRARSLEPDILKRWKEAIRKDKIDVSGYGNKNHWEDLGEFAMLYAYCIDHGVGKGMKHQLKKLSPHRYALWEHILRKCKALPPLYLDKIFVPLRKELGKGNREKAKILSGPTDVKVLKHERGQRKGLVPAKQWLVGLGTSKFKITIDAEVKRWKIADALALVEKIPPLYRRGLEVVSDKGETGLSLFDGGGAFGIPQMIGAGAGVSPGVLCHEIGHVLDQEARKSDRAIMDKYGFARTHDNVRTSGYGDGPVHECHAEFAKFYAIALAAGPKHLAKLRDLSPGRFTVWEKMLVLSGAMPANRFKPALKFDLEAEYKKFVERRKKIEPALKQVHENVKAALKIKEGKK
jgi:hypothetical protein